MKNKQPDSNFFNQFKGSDTTYNLQGENFGNIVFKQISGANKECPIIKQLLSDTLNRTTSLPNLRSKVRDEDLPDVQELVYFITFLKSGLSTYCKNEPLTSGFYYPILATLTQLLLETKKYSGLLYEDLANNLLVNIHIDRDECSMERAIENIYYRTYDFLDSLNRFLDYFTVLLKQESSISKKISVTTQVEQHLLKLVMLIENNIVVATETQRRLEAWLEQLDRLKFQEIYN